MAQFRIEGGAFNYTKNASNAKAQAVFTGSALELGFSGNPSDLQAVLDFIGTQTIEWWVGLNTAYRERVDKTSRAGLNRTEFEL